MAEKRIDMINATPNQQQESLIKIDYIDSETSNNGNREKAPSCIKSPACWCHLPEGKAIFHGLLVLFCGVVIFFNFFRICTLETKISELHQVNGMPNTIQYIDLSNSTSYSRQSRHTASQNGGTHNTGLGTGHDSLMNHQQFGHAFSQHPFLHVTGITSSEVAKGSWFTWHTGEEEDYQNLAIAFLPFINNQFVEIVQPGYYFIYSQVTYQDRHSDYDIGHEVIKRPNCAQGADHRLLQSIQQQKESINIHPDIAFIPQDSGYVGGIFYLTTNDLVGVRPLTGIESQKNNRSYVADQGTSAYFGMFLLTADPTSMVDRHRNCLDEI